MEKKRGARSEEQEVGSKTARQGTPNIEVNVC
jgi:hypothetical protein